jgi:chromosome segregation ATPase
MCAEIEKARALSRALSGELVDLREERRKISGSFNAEGGPLKQIQTLKAHISRVRDELKILYRRFGAEAVSAGPADASPERKQFVASLITQDDQAVLDSAAQIRLSIRDDETAISKLTASLAIDDEKAKIEKCLRSIEDKKARIAEAEKNIAEFEENIKDSEKYIEELQKLL